MGGNPLKANQAALSLLLIGLLAATALTGISPVAYHEECMNGLDDDSDTDVDGFDSQCFYYPFEDGNAENPTPLEERYGSLNYESLFEYHRDFTGSDPALTADLICLALDEEIYDEDDFTSSTQWIADNGFNCESGP